MKTKSQLGQFYTTNAQYIVGNLLDDFDTEIPVIDPFVGEWDLLNQLGQQYQKFGFDLDPKNAATIRQDTLNSPPGYDGYMVLTNPPYLARNKSENKDIFDRYQTDDLYKAALISMLTCEGGAVILPLNFFSSKEDRVRKEFLSRFRITRMNVFEEQVFDDTDYTVCSFSFTKEENVSQEVEFNFLPSGIRKTFTIDLDKGYRIGAEFFQLLETVSPIRVSRLLIGQAPNSKLFLRALDTGTEEGRIGLEMREQPFFGKNTDRAFASLVFSKELSEAAQQQVADEFNRIMKEQRELYQSMFLSTFRNSTAAGSRKRISFDDAYLLVRHVIRKLDLV